MLGWRRLPRPVLIGAVLVALFTIPALVEELKIAHSLAAPTPGNANFINRDEMNALDYLAASKQPGSVMTRSYLGAAVPGRTGRQTYVGDCLWSEPGCLNLTSNAQTLFSGSLSPAAARSFVAEQRRPVRTGRLRDDRRSAASCSARSSARRRASAAPRCMRSSSRTTRVHLGLAATAATVVGLSLGGCGGSRARPVSAFPIPGGRVAAPQTQITFRGVPASHVGRVIVTGSRSGRHSGRLFADSDGQGASFLPTRRVHARRGGHGAHEAAHPRRPGRHVPLHGRPSGRGDSGDAAAAGTAGPRRRADFPSRVRT